MNNLEYFIKRKAELEVSLAENMGQQARIRGGIAEMDYAIEQHAEKLKVPELSVDSTPGSVKADAMPGIHLSNYDVVAPE